MPSTFVNFTPSTVAPFSFQAQLGGAQYTVIVTWNVFGERYYVGVYELSGALVRLQPLVACGPQLSALFSWATGIVTATTAVVHNVPLGQLANVYVSQTGLFDGAQQVVSTGSTTLAYPQVQNPGEPMPVSGLVNFNENLVDRVVPGGYLLFRYETQQFEYGP